MTDCFSEVKQKLVINKRVLKCLESKKENMDSGNVFDFKAKQGIEAQIQNLSSLIDTYEQILKNSGVQEVEKIKEDTPGNIDDLEESAYSGDTDAIEKLIELSQKSPEYAVLANTILAELAQTGDQNVASLIVKYCGKQGDLLAAVMEGNSEYASVAAEKLTDGVLLKDKNGNSFNIETKPLLRKKIVLKLAEDPERNVLRLAKYSDTFEGIEALTSIAVDKPTSYAGRIAARALLQSFVKGNNKISNFALDGLKKAGCCGNAEAVKGLSRAIKSNALGNMKAIKAIDALTEIARTSGQSGSDGALGELVGIAKDKKVSPKLRNHVIENLGSLIEEGKDENFLATDGLIDIARSKSGSSITNKAVNILFRACSKNPEVLNRSVPVLHDVAKGSISTDRKTELYAVDLLEMASAQSADNSDNAKQSLVSLTKHHNQAVAMRAGHAVERSGINPQEYNTDAQKPFLPMMNKDNQQLKPALNLFS